MRLLAPQMSLDYLVPAGREKLRLDEVARILSADDPSGAPVSVQSIRNAMQEGRLFGNRIPFSAALGQEQRIRVEWMTRADVLQALLATRTAAPGDQLDQLCQIVSRLPAEALDELARFIVTQRSAKKFSPAPSGGALKAASGRF